ncbi:hypothetical protein RintRC_2506 [Richelia intracellularis]|nr:hypothetical protein RintRC_2506 [Richelia intracellularis]
MANQRLIHTPVKPKKAKLIHKSSQPKGWEKRSIGNTLKAIANDNVIAVPYAAIMA